MPARRRAAAACLGERSTDIRWLTRRCGRRHPRLTVVTRSLAERSIIGVTVPSARVTGRSPAGSPVRVVGLVVVSLRVRSHIAHECFGRGRSELAHRSRAWRKPAELIARGAPGALRSFGWRRTGVIGFGMIRGLRIEKITAHVIEHSVALFLEQRLLREGAGA